MTSHLSSSDFRAVASWPHPDSYVPGYTRQMYHILERFKAENGSAASLAALAELFKNSASTLNCAAPPQGQHKFRTGQRGVLRGLKKNPELNGCIAVVKAVADDEDGDGRLEVYLDPGSRKDTIRIKPTNLRLDWHVAAAAHATRLGHLVRVSSRNSVFRDTPGRVIAFDEVTGVVTVREATAEAYAATQAKYVNKPDLSGRSNAAGAEAGAAAAVSGDDAAAAAAEPLRNALTLEILEHLEFQEHMPTFIKENISDSMLRSLTQGRLTKDFGFKLGEAVLFSREVQALHAPPPVVTHVAVSEIVPAVYFNLAKELHLTAMHFISKAAGAGATHAVTTVLTAVLAAASFNIRTQSDATASRMCCTVLKMLHTGGPSPSPQKDVDERKSWTHSFTLTCSLTIDREFCNQDYYLAALNMAQVCKQIIEDTLGRDNIVFATLMSNVAKYNGFLHRLEESEVIYKEAIDLIGQLMGKESTQVATSMVSFAGMYKTMGRLDDSVNTFLESLRIIELNSGLDAAEAYYPLNNLAAVYEKQNRLSDAEAMFKRALEIKRRTNQEDSLDYACTMHSLSLLHMKQNRPVDAEAALMQSLSIHERKRGHNVESVARALNSLGSLYETQDLLHLAEAKYKDALRIFEMRLSHESIEVSTTLGYLGLLYQKQNRLQEAEASLQEALAVMKRGLGDEHVQTARCLCNLARVIDAAGNEEEAEGMYKKALALKEKHLGLDSLERAETLSDIAALCQARGSLSEAETMLMEALRINQLLLGPDDEAVAQLENRIAGLCPPPLSRIPDSDA